MPSSIEKRLGMRIKDLRKAKGLTQAALAQRVGTHQVYIAQIEGSATKSPTRTPSLPMLEKIAQALKVKMGELFA
jgi:transcriptional regulator with XRE-family HTH domain